MQNLCLTSSRPMRAGRGLTSSLKGDSLVLRAVSHGPLLRHVDSFEKGCGRQRQAGVTCGAMDAPRAGSFMS
jgi:hypothetical protein